MILIIPTKGVHLEHDQPCEPSQKQLREWIQCKWIEIVRVFHEGAYEQLIVDNKSLSTDKPVNHYATEIYLENVRIHNKDLFLKAHLDNANIRGTAVLLTKENKLT